MKEGLGEVMGEAGGYGDGLGGGLLGGFYEEVLRDAEGNLLMGNNGRDLHRATQAMSEEQLSALLAKLKDDAGLREKLQGAADLDAALAIAKEAGFDVSKADWLNRQANQAIELTDDELEKASGGAGTIFSLCNGCNATYIISNC